MAGKKKDRSAQEPSEATTKLSRLLETEIELEAMLKGARQEAKELVEAAQVAADDRVKQFEAQLESEHSVLQERVARERDHTISSIQEQSRQETTQLDDLDDAKITELAHHVIDLLVGRPDSRGPR
jgi:F0F1-type ATP synthase membrane subunit b/b'